MSTPQTVAEKIAALRAKAAANKAKMEKPEASKSKEIASSAQAPSVQTLPEINSAPTQLPAISNNSAEVVDEGTPLEYEPFKMKLAELQQALENELPGFATVLRDIHREMAKDPNVVTILSPDEIGTIVSGLTKHMDVTIIPAKTASGKAKASKRTQPITADDL